MLMLKPFLRMRRLPKLMNLPLFLRKRQLP
jgi:hypothetical protein